MGHITLQSASKTQTLASSDIFMHVQCAHFQLSANQMTACQLTIFKLELARVYILGADQKKCRLQEPQFSGPMTEGKKC